MADENIPALAVHLLRQLGVDIAWVGEFAPGISDEDVLNHARRDGRIVISFDRDFGELIFHRQISPPLGVLFLRFTPESPEDAAAVIAGVINDTRMQLIGSFTVAHRDHLKQRPLPGNLAPNGLE